MTIPVWPFKVQWDQPVLETFEWMTSILTSRSGAEQRMAQRITPRRMIDYPIQLHGNERAFFDIWMMKNSGMPWYVPIPSEGIAYPYGVAAGDVALPNLDLTYRSQQFAIGAMLVLQDHTFNCEMVEVTSLNGPGMVITPVQKNYPNGCTVSPAILGQITDSVTMTRKSGAVYEGTVRFMGLKQNRRALPAASGLTYMGFPVLTTRPNSANTLDYGYERPLNVLDNKTSIPVYKDPRGFATQTQKFDFFIYGLQERSDFMDMLYRLQGQLSPIWVPTFNDDLAPGAGWIDPDGYLGSVPYRTVAIEFKRDGTFNIRSAASGGSDIPRLLNTGSDIAQTSFMSLKRLGVDSIEISNYATSLGVATASLLFRDAPDLRVPGSYFKNPFNIVGDPTLATTNPPLDLVNPILVSGPSEAF